MRDDWAKRALEATFVAFLALGIALLALLFWVRVLEGRTVEIHVVERCE